MNWEALGSIAELLGAIAVFATLPYLAVQVRQSNVVTKEQAQFHMLQNQLSYFDRLAENPELVKTVYGPDQTQEQIDFRKHEAQIVSILFRWNWEFLRVQDGIYPVDALPVDGLDGNSRPSVSTDTGKTKSHGLTTTLCSLWKPKSYPVQLTSSDHMEKSC